MRRTCAFLVSRQKLHLAPRTWWIRAVYAAAQSFAAQGFVLRTGGGDRIHDFCAWAYRAHGGEVETIERTNGSLAATGPARDAAIMDGIHAAVAIAVRSGGIMERLALAHLAAGGDLRVVEPPKAAREYRGNMNLIERGAKTVALDVSPPAHASHSTVAALATRIDDRSPLLWHFTKSCSGPWPGETQEDYFRSLIVNAPGAAHTADDALRRILTERMIRASATAIKGNYPVVCFTSKSPAELMQMRKFQPHLLRWNYEPFGVGIPLDFAKEAGGRPVIYAAPATYAAMPDGDKYRFQKHAPPDVDYSFEEEWRMLGDFDFSGLPFDELSLFVNNS